MPFSVGPVPFLFTGFVDVNGLDDGADKGVEIWAQPELLVDVLAPFGAQAGQDLRGRRVVAPLATTSASFERFSSAPQLMVQWTVY